MILDPVAGSDVLVVPIVVSIALRVVNLFAVARLMTEVRPGRGVAALRRSVAAVPGVVADAVRHIRGSWVLTCLVFVELFWGFGMVTLEVLLPPRLAEVAGGPDRAAALLGPAVAVAWLASASGAALVPRLQRRWGAAAAAMALHTLQALTVVGMALAAGTVGVLAAYLVTHAAHGAVNPLYKSLLHAEVDASRRATVLSAASMLGHPGTAVGGIVLGLVADSTSVSAAMLVGAAVLLLTVPLYLPARRQARAPAPT